ncbi:MAG: cold shock domain-containing protein [Cyanobacteria bacterium P01_D01_bin.105]
MPDEVAIHNRLDVASASVSGASETRSSVPSEVSELLSVVDPERTDDVSEHFVGDLADEQLPLIQDLLPAVASSDGGSADAESEVKQSKAEESLLKEATADNNAMELSDPAKSALSTDTPARPVLFRFDIIESTEKLESADIQGSVDEHAVKISGAETSKSGADAWTERDASLDGDSVAGLDSPIADGLEVDGLELESDAGTLRSATPIKKEEEEELQPVFQQTESVSSTDPSKNYPVKIGTVKLLFMFKKGNFHGYIAPDDGSKDILFHQKYINADIFTKLERGAQVSAAVKYIEGKAYATHVELL